MKFKQEIKVDENVTQIFNLPCVIKVVKVDEKPFYIFNNANGENDLAELGDLLCEDEDGGWHRMIDD